MSAARLREAAALMRERAEAVTAPEGDGLTDSWAAACAEYIPGADGAFVASWHPVVALAVAAWLDGAAKWLLPCEEPCWERGIEGCPDCEVYGPALAVAEAYLGESS